MNHSFTYRKIKLLISTAALLLSTGCGSPIYIAEDIDSRVVDAETGSPIEGAIVVAHWQLEVRMYHGSRKKGQLKILETETDSQGRFHFDGFTSFNFPNKGLLGSDPQIIVFKSGYEGASFQNHYPKAGTELPGMVRKASVNNKDIRLKKLNLYEKARKEGERMWVHTGFTINLSQLTSSATNCEWKKIPKLILAMDDEIKRIKRLFPASTVLLHGVGHLQKRYKCGSPDEFFGKIKDD